MRTTVAVDDHLLDAAKAAALARGTTLGQVVAAALRRELAEPVGEAPPPVPVFTGGTGVRPGVDVRSSRALAELLDAPEDGPGHPAG